MSTNNITRNYRSNNSNTGFKMKQLLRIHDIIKNNITTYSLQKTQDARDDVLSDIKKQANKAIEVYKSMHYTRNSNHINAVTLYLKIEKLLLTLNTFVEMFDSSIVHNIERFQEHKHINIRKNTRKNSPSEIKEHYRIIKNFAIGFDKKTPSRQSTELTDVFMVHAKKAHALKNKDVKKDILTILEKVQSDIYKRDENTIEDYELYVIDDIVDNFKK